QEIGKAIPSPVKGGSELITFTAQKNEKFGLKPVVAIVVHNAIESNRYIKDNIDIFREFFTNDTDQSDPKYFRGFRPGDINKLPNGKFVSTNHMKDIK
ncbi:11366_t:CDS:2, partial [Ambispora leptoticha]